MSKPIATIDLVFLGAAIVLLIRAVLIWRSARWDTPTAVYNILISVALLFVQLPGLLDLSPAWRTAARVIVAAWMVGTFWYGVAFLSRAKPGTGAQ